MPAASLLKVVEQKNVNRIEDQTLVMADIARKAIAQVVQTVEELVSERMAPEQAKELAQALATGRWTHDFPITVAEARAPGLIVSTDMPPASTS